MHLLGAIRSWQRGTAAALGSAGRLQLLSAQDGSSSCQRRTAAALVSAGRLRFFPAGRCAPDATKWHARQMRRRGAIKAIVANESQRHDHDLFIWKSFRLLLRDQRRNKSTPSTQPEKLFCR
jgi:hypothetical protein